MFVRASGLQVRNQSPHGDANKTTMFGIVNGLTTASDQLSGEEMRLYVAETLERCDGDRF